MRAPSTAGVDQASELTPPLVFNQADDVIEVKFHPEYQLFVRFADGLSGIVDLRALILSPTAGVFAELSNEAVFQQAQIECGAVSWPNGADLAPDAMYTAFRQSGRWTLD